MKKPTRKQMNAALDLLADYQISPATYGLVVNFCEREGKKKADRTIKALPPELRVIVRLALSALLALKKKHKAAGKEVYVDSRILAECLTNEIETGKAA